MLAAQFDLIELNKENQLVNVTIFDNLLQEYRDEEEEYCGLIVTYLLKSLRTKSRKYIEKKYFTKNCKRNKIENFIPMNF